MKERMKNQLQQNNIQNNIQNEEQNTILPQSQPNNEINILKLLSSGSEQEIENLIFSMGEKPEKSLRPQNNNNNDNTNKKNKKNKNKKQK
jgi:hypothetical protein